MPGVITCKVDEVQLTFRYDNKQQLIATIRHINQLLPNASPLPKSLLPKTNKSLEQLLREQVIVSSAEEAQDIARLCSTATEPGISDQGESTAHRVRARSASPGQTRATRVRSGSAQPEGTEKQVRDPIIALKPRPLALDSAAPAADQSLAQQILGIMVEPRNRVVAGLACAQLIWLTSSLLHTNTTMAVSDMQTQIPANSGSVLNAVRAMWACWKQKAALERSMDYARHDIEHAQHRVARLFDDTFGCILGPKIFMSMNNLFKVCLAQIGIPEFLRVCSGFVGSVAASLGN